MNWGRVFELIQQDTVPESLQTVPTPLDTPPTADDLGLPEYMSDYGPLISVVIPTYGDDQFLPDALSTVAHQTYRNIEVIIVDASDIDWLKSLADDREWIRYLSRPPNGISHARNEAIETAHGEYIALLDADDLWHPKKLDRQLTTIREESSICYSALFHLDFTGETNVDIERMDTVLNDPEYAWVDRVHNRIYAMPSTLLLKRDRIPSRPFNEEIDMCEDFLLDVGLFHANPPTHIPDPLVIYRNRMGSVSNESMEAVHQGLFQAIDILQHRLPDDAEPQLQSALGVIERDYARWLQSQGEQSEAKRYWTKALLDRGSFEAYSGNISRATQYFEKAVTVSATEEYSQRVRAEIAILCLNLGFTGMGKKYLIQATNGKINHDQPPAAVLTD